MNAGWRLALVLARLGRDDEAEAVLERTAGTKGGDYVRAWRGVVAATVAAHRGDGERVSRLLDESGALLESRGESGTSADALLQAGDALALVGPTRRSRGPRQAGRSDRRPPRVRRRGARGARTARVLFDRDAVGDAAGDASIREHERRCCEPAALPRRAGISNVSVLPSAAARAARRRVAAG